MMKINHIKYYSTIYPNVYFNFMIYGMMKIYRVDHNALKGE